MKKLLMMIGAAASCVALSMTAVADLPSGYRQLDYVDTDGSQWVNTFFRPTCTNAVEIKAAVPRYSETQFLYCSRRGATDRTYSLCIPTGKVRFDYQVQAESLYTFDASDSSPHVFFSAPTEDAGQEEVAEKSKNWTLNAFVDGTSVGSVAGAYFTPDSSAYFCLFGSYAGSLSDNTTVANLVRCRFYYFKVWDTKDQENLLCHIIPVYGDNEQTVGLYDLVAGRFLPAHGGTFVAPTVISSSRQLSVTEDWSAAPVMIADGATVDLNGHDLTVASVGTNAVSALNVGYQDIAYVTADGGEVVQITGFKLPGTARVETKFSPSNVSGNQFLFSSRKKAKQQAYSALIGGSTIRFDFNDKQTNSNTTLTDDDDYTAVFDGSTPTPTWSVNGTAEATHEATSNDFTGGGDLFIFAQDASSTGNRFTGRLYCFTVSTNDVTILDLHPVRRISDGTVGLYDSVGNNFYASGTALSAPANAPKFVNASETTSELRVGQELMPGYTVVDRISVADSFIKTEYVPDATDRLEMKASLSAVTETYGLFCSRKAKTSEMFVALLTSGVVRFDFGESSGGQKTTAFAPAQNEVFTIALDGNEKVCYTNGAVAATFASNDFTPSATVYLFALHTADSNSDKRAPGDIYWFKVRGADGTLKVDMVPVVRNSDSAAGLYDRVRRKFYQTANGKPFTAGTQVGDGMLHVDADSAFVGTEISGNITLVKNGESAFDGGGLSLTTTLKPVAGTVGGVTLTDGATLDLSEFDGSFSLDDNAVSFADGATITLALGSRTASSKSPLVSWTTPPANLGTLKFVRAVGASRGFVVKSDGIYLAPNGLIISFF